MVLRTINGDLCALAYAEDQRAERNRAVVRALREIPAAVGAAVGVQWEREDSKRYEEALATAFPPDDLGGHADPETTLGFDYRRHYEGDGPVGWSSDTQNLLLRFLRQASEEGVPHLVADLERLREKATVQLFLAERDYERRWLALPREERRAIIRAGEEDVGDA